MAPARTPTSTSRPSFDKEEYTVKKTFAYPEVKAVRLSATEAVMSSMLREKGANGKIIYSIIDSPREDLEKQKYWAGK